MQASCTPNIKVSTQILRPINFIRLANQTGGILHSPPTPTQGGSSSSSLVMRNNKFIPVINVNHWKGLGMERGVGETQVNLCSAFDFWPRSWKYWLNQVISPCFGWLLSLSSKPVCELDSQMHKCWDGKIDQVPHASSASSLSGLTLIGEFI